MAGPSDCQKELSGALHAYPASAVPTRDLTTLRGRYSERAPWALFQSSKAKMIMLGDSSERLIEIRLGIVVKNCYLRINVSIHGVVSIDV
jgi:hypothetical protein